MTIELANKVRGGRAVGNEYVVTRRDEGNSGIIARFDSRELAQAFIDNGGEVVEIEGVAYQVLKAVTPERAEADGHKATADMMRENRQRRQLYMKRPAGVKMYFAVEFDTRLGARCGNVVTLGSW